MIEGWAVYTEKMMLENGYGNNYPAMWLMYYKWNLRSTCNTIIDYSIQVNNMQKEAVINLLTKEAFQQHPQVAAAMSHVQQQVLEGSMAASTAARQLLALASRTVD